MSVYQATVDPAERNTSHTLMLELVGRDKAVLDVGCASGYLAEALAKNGCLVSGVEYDELDAEKARPFLQELVVADLNIVDLAEQLPKSSYDVIVFGDVLEHLMAPARVLESSLALLRPGGAVVISIPNVAHGSVRLSLLQGRWNYSDTGLLDKTHIRFFTLESLLVMLKNAGLTVTDLRSTTADPLATEIGIDANDLPPESVDWVRRQNNAYAYQFVLSAQVGADHPDGERLEVVPAIPILPIRDIHTEQAELRRTIAELQAQAAQQASRITELRRQVLTSKDHAIGTEASLGQLRVLLHEARLNAQYANAEMAKAQEASTRLEQHINPRRRFRHAFALVIGPRAWRLISAPVRLTRRAIGGPR